MPKAVSGGGKRKQELLKELRVAIPNKQKK